MLHWHLYSDDTREQFQGIQYGTKLNGYHGNRRKVKGAIPCTHLGGCTNTYAILRHTIATVVRVSILVLYLRKTIVVETSYVHYDYCTCLAT